MCVSRRCSSRQVVSSVLGEAQYKSWQWPAGFMHIKCAAPRVHQSVLMKQQGFIGSTHDVTTLRFTTASYYADFLAPPVERHVEFILRCLNLLINPQLTHYHIN